MCFNPIEKLLTLITFEGNLSKWPTVAGNLLRSPVRSLCHTKNQIGNWRNQIKPKEWTPAEVVETTNPLHCIHHEGAESN